MCLIKVINNIQYPTQSNENIFPIAFWDGTDKIEDIEQFLDQLAEDIKELQNNPYVFDDEKYQIFFVQGGDWALLESICSLKKQGFFCSYGKTSWEHRSRHDADCLTYLVVNYLNITDIVICNLHGEYRGTERIILTMIKNDHNVAKYLLEKIRKKCGEWFNIKVEKKAEMNRREKIDLDDLTYEENNVYRFSINKL